MYLRQVSCQPLTTSSKQQPRSCNVALVCPEQKLVLLSPTTQISQEATDTPKGYFYAQQFAQQRMSPASCQLLKRKITDCDNDGIIVCVLFSAIFDLVIEVGPVK